VPHSAARERQTPEGRERGRARAYVQGTAGGSCHRVSMRCGPHGGAAGETTHADSRQPATATRQRTCLPAQRGRSVRQGTNRSGRRSVSVACYTCTADRVLRARGDARCWRVCGWCVGGGESWGVGKGCMERHGRVPAWIMGASRRHRWLPAARTRESVQDAARIDTVQVCSILPEADAFEFACPVCSLYCSRWRPRAVCDACERLV
jgi:hypothetical protein